MTLLVEIVQVVGIPFVVTGADAKDLTTKQSKRLPPH